jgi:hypothetical protein
MKTLFTLMSGLGLAVLMLLGTQTQAAPPPSPSVQTFLDNLTPAARELALNSQKASTPAGLQAMERDLDALDKTIRPMMENLNQQTAALYKILGLPAPVMTTDGRVLAAQYVSDALRYVPANQQQRYMNGVFALSFEEKRFADEVTKQYMETIKRQIEINQQLLR